MIEVLFIGESFTVYQKISHVSHLGLTMFLSSLLFLSDLKPDNLLIDSKGHLKLTDFGLSKIGLLNRQVGGPRPAVLRGTSLKRLEGFGDSPLALSATSGDSLVGTPDLLGPAVSSYFGGHMADVGSADESSGSDQVSSHKIRSLSNSSDIRLGLKSPERNSRRESKEPAKFVGTPDYLCPEAILGFGADDETVDWWALGVVLYEFLFGFPPFHDETPERVFDNIVSRRINWYEEHMELSAEARDLMERLMCTDPKNRLGANGANEIKSHPFFAGLDWDSICTVEASFIPNVVDPESTDYFDARGATPVVFHDECEEGGQNPKPHGARVSKDRALANLQQQIREDSVSPSASGDDFGAFNFRNLSVLKQANDDAIKKLRSDSIIPGSAGLPIRDRRLSLVSRKRGQHLGSLTDVPPSPSPSTSSSASTPSRTPVSTTVTLPSRRVSGQHQQVTAIAETDKRDVIRRKSAPESTECAGIPVNQDESSILPLAPAPSKDVSPLSSSTSTPPPPATPSGLAPLTPGRPPLAPRTLIPRKVTGRGFNGRPCDVLIAEDNPISQKILETLLTRMGCRCVCVADGAEALAASMSDIRFDLIFLDLVIPNVSGEEVARMIRSTNNPNVNTPSEYSSGVICLGI